MIFKYLTGLPLEREIWNYPRTAKVRRAEQFPRDPKRCMIQGMVKRFPIWVYIVGVLAAWAIVLFAVSQLRPTVFMSAVAVCAGFFLGMLAMYIAVHFYRTDLDT